MAHEKDKEFVEEITEYIKDKAQQHFGFCGVASGDNVKMLNTGKGNIIIKIEIK